MIENTDLPEATSKKLWATADKIGVNLVGGFHLLALFAIGGIIV